MATMKLTSPNMRGKSVKALQKKLAGANAFKTNYHPGKVDGVYGKNTASAVKRAKYHIGFPPKFINTAAGKTFQDVLSGKRRQPRRYKITAWRRKRAKAKAKKSIRLKAYAYAVKQLGVKESPAGSNKVRFSDWYKMRGPWCAMFVTWAFVAAGSKSFVRAQRYAYCPYVVADAVGNKYGLSTTTSPVRGDLVMFDWGKDGISDHIGIFEGWKSKSKGTFTAIEGNTSTSSNSNGGEVMRRSRNRTQVQVFIRVSR